MWKHEFHRILLTHHQNNINNMITLSCFTVPNQQYIMFPSPGDLPISGIESRSPALQENSLPSEPTGKPLFIYIYIYKYKYI